MTPEVALLMAGIASVVVGLGEYLSGAGPDQLVISISTAAALWLCGLCLGLTDPINRREGGSK